MTSTVCFFAELLWWDFSVSASVANAGPVYGACMETKMEFVKIAIAAPAYAPPRTQQRPRRERAAVLGRARSTETCGVRGRSYVGADRVSAVLENVAWITLAISSGAVLMLSL
jgi:hypothetical protein